MPDEGTIRYHGVLVRISLLDIVGVCATKSLTKATAVRFRLSSGSNLVLCTAMLRKVTIEEQRILLIVS